jgi:hypothetical protein
MSILQNFRYTGNSFAKRGKIESVEVHFWHDVFFEDYIKTPALGGRGYSQGKRCDN